MTYRKDLVVWMSPPIPLVVLDTRRTFKAYTDALREIVANTIDPVHGEYFDISEHMNEMGVALVSLIDHFPSLRTKVADYFKHYWGFVPNPQDEVQLKMEFFHLIQAAAEAARVCQLYNGDGTLFYHFYNWTAGCLVIEYTNRTVATVDRSHWLTQKP
ncbi:MAG TPA: hypothetical protein VN081_05815 [Dongiaceae bacterium]|nr:hypothetical protein [Dongiaceae bacterium]